MRKVGTMKKKNKGQTKKSKGTAPPTRGGTGPLVRDRKEAVQKGASPARRARGDHPR
jgi:hypothetical protein